MKGEEMSMIGPKMGTWWVYSEIDPRWNKEGRAAGLVTLNGPREAQEWIEDCRGKYGDPPDDVESGFMKD